MHKGSAGVGPDIEKIISEHPCSKVYAALEECLGESDRNWSKCQPIVASLKECNQKIKQRDGTQLHKSVDTKHPE